MKRILLMAAAVAVNLLLALPALCADQKPEEKFPVLKIGDEVYTNVTVTSVTATDIYFSHSRGMGNGKLKNLDAVMRKHFNYNPTNAASAEQKRREDSWSFRVDLASKKPAAKEDTSIKPAPDDSDDFVAPDLHAKSVRGQRPPQIIIDQFLTAPPDPTGKFVLIDFWATWCGPCRASIPHLNELQSTFRDRLVVIGLTDETPEEVKKMKSPAIGYFLGVDTQARTRQALEVRGIPHAILIDPNGIVRFEGMPSYLEASMLAGLIRKYGGE